MIRINNKRIIQNTILIKNLNRIMDKQDAEKLVQQLEYCQKFQIEMKKQLATPDKVQVAFEKKMDEERFLRKVNELYFNGCSVEEAVEKAKEEIDIDPKDARKILQNIIKIQEVNA